MVHKNSSIISLLVKYQVDSKLGQITGKFDTVRGKLQLLNYSKQTLHNTFGSSNECDIWIGLVPDGWEQLLR